MTGLADLAGLRRPDGGRVGGLEPPRSLRAALRMRFSRTAFSRLIFAIVVRFFELDAMGILPVRGKSGADTTAGPLQGRRWDTFSVVRLRAAAAERLRGPEPYGKVKRQAWTERPMDRTGITRLEVLWGARETRGLR